MEDLTPKKRLLNPLDRAAEILFGLIMALTFTCSISIANPHRAEIRQLLIGAIGCNLAWGLVDAAMYLIGVLARKSRSNMIFDAVKNSADTDKAIKYISDAVPPVIASAIEPEEMEDISKRIINRPEAIAGVRLTLRDIGKATALFFLIFISTFPVVVPFVFIHDTIVALRGSNAIAIAMMFLCGWSVARYVGFSKWKMGFAMILIGVVLVAITIALGG